MAAEQQPVSKCENFEKKLDFYYMFNYMDQSWFIMDDLCIVSFSSRTNQVYVRELVAEWTKSWQMSVYME